MAQIRVKTCGVLFEINFGKNSWNAAGTEVNLNISSTYSWLVDIVAFVSPAGMFNQRTRWDPLQNQ